MERLVTEWCDLIYLPKDRLSLGEPTSLEEARASVGKVWGASEEVTAVLGGSLPHREVCLGEVALMVRNSPLLGTPD